MVRDREPPQHGAGRVTHDAQSQPDEPMTECPNCGRTVPMSKMHYDDPDPFSWEIHDDPTVVVQCDTCYQQRADDI